MGKSLQDILCHGDREEAVESHSGARVGTQWLKVLTNGSFSSLKKEEEVPGPQKVSDSEVI